MAEDYWGNGYWGTGYWASGYWGQGGTVPPVPPTPALIVQRPTLYRKRQRTKPDIDLEAIAALTIILARRQQQK